MCAKTIYSMNRKLCGCFKFIMSCIIKIFLVFPKRLLKLTLCQLLWTTLFIFFVIVVWTYNNSQQVADIKLSEHPVILWWSEQFPGTSETRHCSNSVICEVYSQKNLNNQYKSDAYLFYGSNIDFNSLPLPRRPLDIIWGLYHEESPRNSEELMHEAVLNIFNFSSTYSRYSNVPFPLQYLHSLSDITTLQYFVETSLKNELLDEIAPIMYLQTDCETSSERDNYVKELMKNINVDSYGACLNNKELPEQFKGDYLNNLNEHEFLKFVARYKFVIAIENGVCHDYVTEKLWRAIKVGTVPIYFGSPSIKDWLPNENSAIVLEDFPTIELLVQHIDKLLGNDDLYEEYLEHKIEQVVMNERLLEEIQIRPYQFDVLQSVHEFECFVCKKIHEKKEGISGVHVVNKSHYDCPKPLSALTLNVNPKNSWVYSWETNKKLSEKIYNSVMKQV